MAHTSGALKSPSPLPQVFFEIVPSLTDKNVSNELAITKNLPVFNPKSIRDQRRKFMG